MCDLCTSDSFEQFRFTASHLVQHLVHSTHSRRCCVSWLLPKLHENPVHRPSRSDATSNPLTPCLAAASGTLSAKLQAWSARRVRRRGCWRLQWMQRHAARRRSAGWRLWRPVCRSWCCALGTSSRRRRKRFHGCLQGGASTCWATSTLCCPPRGCRQLQAGHGT